MARILIVDDSALARKLLRTIIENLGHEVVGEAESGEQAILQYRKLTPDIVTMDLIMRGIGGIETSQKIISFFPDAKIIIVTSHIENDLKTELINNGLKYLIIKPVVEIKVSEAIQHVLIGTDTNITNNDITDKKLKEEMHIFLTNIARKISEREILGMDSLKVGDIVSISHFNMIEPLIGKVTEKRSNIITLIFSKEISNFKLAADDLITLCYNSNEEYKICEASILDVMQKEKNIKIEITKINLLYDNELEENFPTSLTIDYKVEFDNKKQTAIVKNIGPYKMQIISKSELNIEDRISFDIYLDNKVITIRAEIESKVPRVQLFEYKIKYTFIDLSNKKFLKLFIQSLKEIQVKTVKSLSTK